NKCTKVSAASATNAAGASNADNKKGIANASETAGIQQWAPRSRSSHRSASFPLASDPTRPGTTIATASAAPTSPGDQPCTRWKNEGVHASSENIPKPAAPPATISQRY